jgi:Na+-transporting NADH:ubiquinone oxidoreductase subunit E
VVTVPVNWILENYLLKAGALEWLNPAWKDVDLSFISFIMFIAVVASIVQLVEMLVEKFSPSLYGALGIFLPLIAVNCSILGGALFMQERQYSTFLDVTAFSMGSGIGWAIAIIFIAAIREKIRYSHIPAPLRGLGITFIITGLMGIAFMSFMGITYVDEPKKDKKVGTTMIEDASVLRADVLDSSFKTEK